MEVITPLAAGLEAHGITHPADVHWNLGTAALYEQALNRGEGAVAETGPLVCLTGVHTGRSPNDKFLVREPSSEANVWWGKTESIDHADAVRRRSAGHARVARGEGAFRSGTASPARIVSSSYRSASSRSVRGTACLHGRCSCLELPVAEIRHISPSSR